MNVDATSLAYVQSVLRTASIVKIGNIVIAPNLVKGADDTKTVIIYQTTGIPAMPFGSIGINRADVFSSRVEIAKTAENFSIDAVMHTSTEQPFVRALTMKGKGIKIDYRCANPQVIPAPKFFNEVVTHSMKITPEAISLMQRGQAAMSTDEISFIGNDTGISFEMSDVNNDALVYQIDDHIVSATGDAPNFSHKYPIKTVYSLFKANTDGFFHVTSRGLLKVVVNSLDIYVLARD